MSNCLRRFMHVFLLCLGAFDRRTEHKGGKIKLTYARSQALSRDEQTVALACLIMNADAWLEAKCEATRPVMLTQTE